MNQFEIYIANLNPTQDFEINKIRPVLIISPDEMNHHIKTVIIAPITSKSREYPTRIKFKLGEQDSYIVLDQIRTIDKLRLTKLIGNLENKYCQKVKNTLYEMFA